MRLPLNQVGSLNKINKAFARFEQEHERTPSPEELATELELPKEKVTDTLRVAGRHVSVDAPFADGEDNSLLDVLVNPDSPNADRGLINESLSTEVDRALETLTERERDIIKYFFGIGTSEMTLEEIGEKILDNYASQILDHGFFHADPHPGNILVRGDDIVWIDLGMVGQLSALERALIGRMFRAVAENDPYALMEALLGAVRSEGPVNHGRLLSQLGNLLVSYTTVNLADINVGSALMDVFGVLQTQNLALPPSFTLLARGMVTIEGVLVDIAPDTSVIDIIAAHVKRRERTWEAFETKAREFVSTAATSAQAAVRLPTQASHTLDMIDRGQVRVGADLGIPIDAIAALYSVSGTVAMALISAGLFIGSSLLATTNMHPQFLGVPLLGVLGYVGAFVLGAYVVWRNLVIRHRQKNEEKL